MTRRWVWSARPAARHSAALAPSPGKMVPTADPPPLVCPHGSGTSTGSGARVPNDVRRHGAVIAAGGLLAADVAVIAGRAGPAPAPPHKP